MAGAVGVGTGGAMFLDNDMRELMQRSQSGGADKISDISVEYGSGVNMLLLSAGGYAAGLIFEEDWLRETAMLSGSAILIAGVVSTVTKVVAGRARPYTGLGSGMWRPFSLKVDYESFPSGHVIVAFAVSGVLAERIGNPWATVGLYGLAAATAWSRMYTDHHWFSDVILAAAISVSVSRSLVQWYEGESKGESDEGIGIVPMRGGIGLILVF
ncbi:MAG: phosphatase PAP2 family protein [Bacteroidota bacterium]